MIDKLDAGYAVGDPIVRGIVNKLNELIDDYNEHRHIRFTNHEDLTSVPAKSLEN